MFFSRTAFNFNFILDILFCLFSSSFVYKTDLADGNRGSLISPEFQAFQSKSGGIPHLYRVLNRKYRNLGVITRSGSHGRCFCTCSGQCRSNPKWGKFTDVAASCCEFLPQNYWAEYVQGRQDEADQGARMRAASPRRP